MCGFPPIWGFIQAIEMFQVMFLLCVNVQVRQEECGVKKPITYINKIDGL
jgi:hypothetical protein